MSRFIRGALSTLPAMLLAACGGGGGGDSAPPPAAPAISALVITSANAQPVAAEALQMSTNFDAAEVGTSIATGVQVDAGPAAANRSVLLAGVARKLVSMAPDAAALVTGVTTTTPLNCSGGGTLTVTETSSGGTGTVAGDEVSITANNCVETVDGAVVRMNGTMTVTIVSGSYDSSSMVYPKSVTMKIVTQNFSMVQGGETSVSNGDLQVAMIENSPNYVDLTLTANALSNTVTTASATHAVTLRSYLHKVNSAPDGAIVQMGASVETTNSRLGSGAVSYTISTPTPIQLNASGAYLAGSVKVAGASSALLLSVTATDTFSLQVDTNGDGTYDATSTVTRSQLQAAL